MAFTQGPRKDCMVEPRPLTRLYKTPTRTIWWNLCVLRKILTTQGPYGGTSSPGASRQDPHEDRMLEHPPLHAVL